MLPHWGVCTRLAVLDRRDWLRDRFERRRGIPREAPILIESGDTHPLRRRNPGHGYSRVLRQPDHRRRVPDPEGRRSREVSVLWREWPMLLHARGKHGRWKGKAGRPGGRRPDLAP